MNIVIFSKFCECSQLSSSILHSHLAALPRSVITTSLHRDGCQAVAFSSDVVENKIKVKASTLDL